MGVRDPQDRFAVMRIPVSGCVAVWQRSCGKWYLGISCVFLSFGTCCAVDRESEAELELPASKAGDTVGHRDERETGTLFECGASDVCHAVRDPYEREAGAIAESRTANVRHAVWDHHRLEVLALTKRGTADFRHGEAVDFRGYRDGRGRTAAAFDRDVVFMFRVFQVCHCGVAFMSFRSVR